MKRYLLRRARSRRMQVTYAPPTLTVTGGLSPYTVTGLNFDGLTLVGSNPEDTRVTIYDARGSKKFFMVPATDEAEQLPINSYTYFYEEEPGVYVVMIPLVFPVEVTAVLDSNSNPYNVLDQKQYMNRLELKLDRPPDYDIRVLYSKLEIGETSFDEAGGVDGVNVYYDSMYSHSNSWGRRITEVEINGVWYVPEGVDGLLTEWAEGPFRYKYELIKPEGFDYITSEQGWWEFVYDNPNIGTSQEYIQPSLYGLSLPIIPYGDYTDAPFKVHYAFEIPKARAMFKNGHAVGLYTIIGDKVLIPEAPEGTTVNPVDWIIKKDGVPFVADNITLGSSDEFPGVTMYEIEGLGSYSELIIDQIAGGIEPQPVDLTVTAEGINDGYWNFTFSLPTISKITSVYVGGEPVTLAYYSSYNEKVDGELVATYRVSLLDIPDYTGGLLEFRISS